MADRDDDFLSRWSRRKVDARRGLRKKEGPEAPEAAGQGDGAQAASPPAVRERRPGVMNTDPPPPRTAPPEDGEPEREQAALATGDGPAGGADEQAVEAAEAPDPAELENIDFDALDYDSDYKRFMGSDVPEAIRKRALQMLWQSNPILANVDGLNDYDEDFTDAALAVKKLATSWNVGSGYDTPEERLAKTTIEDDDAEEVAATDEDAVETAEDADRSVDKEDSGAGEQVAEAEGNAEPSADMTPDGPPGTAETHEKT